MQLVGVVFRCKLLVRGWCRRYCAGQTPNAITLAAQDRERGTWVEPISWYPRAFHMHNIMAGG
jgi:hypothetical protein